MTARFEHSVDDAHRLAGRIGAIYWALAAGIAIVGLFRREWLVIAVVFAVVLVLWRRQVRRAMPTKPWVLEIGVEHITLDRNGVVETVRRGDDRVDHIVREVEGLPGVAQALEERGWPTTR